MTDYFENTKSLETQIYFAAVIASSDDAIISKDLNGNIMSWNPAAERIFGFSAKEAIGKHISIIIPADKLPEEDYILGQIKQGYHIDHFETIRRTKSGNPVNISVTISPIKNSSGEIIGASKIARDITAIKDAERSNAYLSSIIESSNDAIISKDLNGFITSWNRAAQNIFGYAPEEIIGRHITAIIPPGHLSEEDEIITTLETGERIEHFETVRRHKNGHLVDVSLSISPIRDIHGKIIGVSKIARDISERLRIEEELKESVRKKDEFLANMSHELRTPMNAVIGLSHLLKRMDDLPDRARKYVDTLKLSADNLMDLINDILDFAKIESGSFEIEHVEFNLSEQIEKVISVANISAHEKGLDLYVNYSPLLNRYYMGDPLRIHQILMNLVVNAVKFTEKGFVEIDIAGAPDEDSNITIAVFKITDTGIGIPENKLGVIFDKFTQADSSMTRKYGGSGLGLSITKACIEKMHGSLAVESQIGVGTTFTVTLPLLNTEKISSIDSFSANAASPTPAGRKSILLVEDYEPNVIVAEAMLSQLGYDYDVANNGIEALRKFSRGEYGVILMDVQMHDLDGLETTRRIRRIETDEGRSPTPIIAMTAHVREQDRKQCFDAGMDDFIPKPFEPALLSQKIEHHIRHRLFRSGQAGPFDKPEACAPE